MIATFVIAVTMPIPLVKWSDIAVTKPSVRSYGAPLQGKAPV